jgi:hypothetical protein
VGTLELIFFVTILLGIGGVLDGWINRKGKK